MTKRYSTVSLEEVLPSRRTKLEEWQVREIRQLHKQGAAISKLAKVFFVSRPTIRAIIKRETWNHVSDQGA